MIFTNIVWHPATVRPIKSVLAKIAVDRGADCDPEEFRVYLLSDLYEYRENLLGEGGFVNIQNNQLLTDKVFYWASYEHIVLDIEGQLEMAVAP